MLCDSRYAADRGWVRKYRGKRTFRKIAQLKKPVKCYNPVQGVVYFKPTIVQVEWETPPSGDTNEFWFPYWMTVDGKEKYGQFAPIIGENALLELLQDAIEQDFFSEGCLRSLQETIERRLSD